MTNTPDNNDRHERALAKSVAAAMSMSGAGSYLTMAEAIIAAYLSEMDAVIVPREPTDGMIGDGLRKFYGFGKPSNGMCNAYRAMLSAAPHHFNQEGK